MRSIIKTQLCAACLFAVSAPVAFANQDNSGLALSSTVNPSVMLQSKDQIPGLFFDIGTRPYPALDLLKAQADKYGQAFVAQAETKIISDAPTTIAVAQIAGGVPASNPNYRFFGALLMVLAGCFMWLTLSPRRNS